MYADRVIWMRDGKIQRIETVDKVARKEHYARLDREIQSKSYQFKETNDGNASSNRLQVYC
eukprot:gene14023-16527_t